MQRGGWPDIDHDVSMLMRGEAGRRATVPSTVSMTIMRPPQRGHGRDELGGSTSRELSAALFEPGCAGDVSN